jgi:hypothetical protein
MLQEFTLCKTAARHSKKFEPPSILMIGKTGSKSRWLA